MKKMDEVLSWALFIGGLLMVIWLLGMWLIPHTEPKACQSGNYYIDNVIMPIGGVGMCLCWSFSLVQFFQRKFL